MVEKAYLSLESRRNDIIPHCRSGIPNGSREQSRVCPNPQPQPQPQPQPTIPSHSTPFTTMVPAATETVSRSTGAPDNDDGPNATSMAAAATALAFPDHAAAAVAEAVAQAVHGATRLPQSHLPQQPPQPSSSSLQTPVPRALAPGWVRKPSRSQPNYAYYFQPETGICTWREPVRVVPEHPPAGDDEENPDNNNNNNHDNNNDDTVVDETGAVGATTEEDDDGDDRVDSLAFLDNGLSPPLLLLPPPLVGAEGKDRFE